MSGCKDVNHLQGADAALHTRCRHLAPLRGSRIAAYLPRPHPGERGIAEHRRARCMCTCKMHACLYNMHAYLQNAHTYAQYAHTHLQYACTHTPQLPPPTLHHSDNTLAPLHPSFSLHRQ